MSEVHRFWLALIGLLCSTGLAVLYMLLKRKCPHVWGDLSKYRCVRIEGGGKCEYTQQTLKCEICGEVTSRLLDTE